MKSRRRSRHDRHNKAVDDFLVLGLWLSPLPGTELGLVLLADGTGVLNGIG
jgi:hypothetical protein